MSFFQINTCSPSKNIEELEYLIKNGFDVVGIRESRIKKNNCPINSINVKEYSYDSCPTEYSEGGTLLYISNLLSCKARSDLSIYQSTELESIFIEILSSKKKNVIVACIYRHPHMNLNEFNDYDVNTSIIYWII